MGYRNQGPSDAVFLNKQKDGSYAGQVKGKDVIVELLDDSSLGVTCGDLAKSFPMKSNDRGQYWVCDLSDAGIGRFFANHGKSSKGEYVRFKPAKDRPMDDGGRPQRPQTYGGRR
jgi:hypothetical protein